MSDLTTKRLDELNVDYKAWHEIHRSQTIEELIDYHKETQRQLNLNKLKGELYE